MNISHLMLLCILLLGLQSCNPMEGFEPFEVANNKSEDFHLSVYVKASQGFGACNVKLFAKSDDGVETLVISDKLYNDGANLGMNNIKIVWLTDKVALVTLDGQEQVAKVYRIIHEEKGKYTTSIEG